MNADTIVRALTEAMADPGDKPMPSAEVDAEAVIKDQLTENTGSHPLDSGGAYGRHWEENKHNPPWNKARIQVRDGYVIKNVHHHLNESLSRNEECVELEAGLYAYARNGPGEIDSWLTCMEDFAEGLMSGAFTPEDIESWGIPTGTAEALAYGYRDRDVTPMTFNSYNAEFGSLTQCIQATGLGGPHTDLWMVQVHQGADIRGGYTAPRVYHSGFGSPMTHEFEFDGHLTDWIGYESVLYGDDSLLFQETIDPWELEEVARDRISPYVGRAQLTQAIDNAIEVAYSQEEIGNVSGAVFRVTPGELEYVHVH